VAEQLCNEILAQEEPDPAAPTPSGGAPELAIPWWQRVVERWWIHRAIGMIALRHRPSLACCVRLNVTMQTTVKRYALTRAQLIDFDRQRSMA
jgi:hypothetical protein